MLGIPVTDQNALPPDEIAASVHPNAPVPHQFSNANRKESDEFPTAPDESPAVDEPSLRTLREILDKLSELAQPEPGTLDHDRPPRERDV